MNRRPLAALVLALALALPAGAVQVSTHEYHGVVHSYSWPSDVGGTGQFGRGSRGHFTDLAALDALVLDGDRPVVLVHPDQVFAPSELPFSAKDADAAPLCGLGGRDAIAVVDAAGLHLAWYDDVAHDFTSSLVAGGAWAGATLVRAAKLGGSGNVGLVGVGADRRTVLALNSLGGAPATFAPRFAFQAIAEVRDIVALQWDADPELEIAVLSEAGVEVYDQNGAWKNAWPAVMPGGGIAKLSQSTSASDRLVWITPYAPPAQQWLMVLSPSGMDDYVDLGNLDAVTPVADDYDLDGDDDVLISHRLSYKLVWLENQRSPSSPSGTSFTGAISCMRLFSMEADDISASENRAWPILGDFDGDGDRDIVFPVQRTSKLRVLRGEPVLEGNFTANPTSATYDHASGASSGTLTVSLAAPASVPSSATHLEIEAWRQASSTACVTQQSYSSQLLPIPSSWPLAAPVTIPEASDTFSSIYHVQFRLVALGSDGSVTRAWPTRAIAFASNASAVEALEAVSGASVPVNVGGGMPEDVSSSRPTFVNRMHTNGFAKDLVPVPAPL